MSSQALLKTPKTMQIEAPGELRPLDLVHLAHQTLGDRSLETELLTLFDRQADLILRQIEAGAGAPDRRLRKDLAHTIKGSAKAVGACRVAAMAEAYEAVLYSGASEGKVAEACADLSRAVAEARQAIGGLLAEA